MEYSELLKHTMDNCDYWYTDPNLGKQQAHNEFISAFSRVHTFCKKYNLPSPGVFKFEDTSEVVRKLTFLKMRKVITVEKLTSLYKMATSDDQETQKLTKMMITNLMEKTK
jgi:hypothetical protein